MATAERIIIGSPNAFASATVTVSGEVVAGQADAELLIPLASKGWLVDIADGDPVDVVLDAGSPRIMQSIWTSGARSIGFAPGDLEVKVETASTAAIDADVTVWADGPYRTVGQGPAGDRLDMTDPELGPSDAQLADIMLQGRYHRLDRLAEGAEVTRQFVRLTFTHTATPAGGQRLFIPWVSAGWGFELDFNPAAGQASFGQVYEAGSGRMLKKWDLTLQYMREDDLWSRLHRDFLATSTEELRLWVAREVGDPARFYEKSMVCWSRFADTSYGTGVASNEARVNTTPVTFVERFGVENVQ